MAQAWQQHFGRNDESDQVNCGNHYGSFSVTEGKVDSDELTNGGYHPDPNSLRNERARGLMRGQGIEMTALKNENDQRFRKCNRSNSCRDCDPKCQAHSKCKCFRNRIQLTAGDEA